LISDCRNSAIVGRWNLASAGIQQHPATGILLAPKFQPKLAIIWPSSTAGRILPKWSESGRFWTDPAEFGQNGRDPPGYDRIRKSLAGIRPNLLAGIRQWRPDVPDFGGIYHTLIFAFRNFFVQAKRRKIFSRKSFFKKNDFDENILRQKSFYVETNGALETVLGMWQKFTYQSN
jgi:hypothetical protein